MNISSLTRDRTLARTIHGWSCSFLTSLARSFRKLVRLYLASVESAVSPVVSGIEAPKGERKRKGEELPSSRIQPILASRSATKETEREKKRKREGERGRGRVGGKEDERSFYLW